MQQPRCSSLEVQKTFLIMRLWELFVTRHGSEGEGEVGDLPVSFVDNFMCPGAFAVLGSKVLQIANHH